MQFDCPARSALLIPIAVASGCGVGGAAAAGALLAAVEVDAGGIASDGEGPGVAIAACPRAPVGRPRLENASPDDRGKKRTGARDLAVRPVRALSVSDAASQSCSARADATPPVPTPTPSAAGPVSDVPPLAPGTRSHPRQSRQMTSDFFRGNSVGKLAQPRIDPYQNAAPSTAPHRRCADRKTARGKRVVRVFSRRAPRPRQASVT